MARLKFTFKRLRMDLDEAGSSGDDAFNFDTGDEAETAAALAAVQIPAPSLSAVRPLAADWESENRWKKPRLMASGTQVKPAGSWIGVAEIAPTKTKTFGSVSRLAAASNEDRGISFAGNAEHAAIGHPSQLQYPTTCTTVDTSTSEKPKLLVMRGDPTDWSTAAIVNDANSLLQHKCGLGAAIVRKGGVEIQRQSTAWVYRYGEVHVGCAMWTTAGNLSSRFIIHTVGPDVSRHRWPTQQHQLGLRRAVRSALMVADGLGVTSVLMPAISMGSGRYPKYLAAQEIVTECLQYCNDCSATKLRLIVLMNEDEVTTSIFKQVLKEKNQQRQRASVVQMPHACSEWSGTLDDDNPPASEQKQHFRGEESTSKVATPLFSGLKGTV
ncbi:unnamed protein product [Phytophthora fragariaefolia]|uniref:Unnamed protein product n=1 Tax=Phytophthora fragariaefolia TaxID=1490495 RepID=A0A9W6XSA7_9STRA|nr:unnamed protein product [Phytophthora fragariaefolia]